MKNVDKAFATTTSWSPASKLSQTISNEAVAIFNQCWLQPRFPMSTMPSQEGSVTEYLDRAKQGESYAEHLLWARYTTQLVGLARQRLRSSGGSIADCEDVALSAFHDLLNGLHDDRFDQLSGRDDLWQVLAMLTIRRSIDSNRRRTASKRGGVAFVTDQCALHGSEHDDANGLEDLCDLRPTPEQVLLLEEEFHLRLEQLEDDKVRAVAIAKMRGLGNQEIAYDLGCSLRSVERKISIIRRRWLEVGNPQSSDKS